MKMSFGGEMLPAAETLALRDIYGMNK